MDNKAQTRQLLTDLFSSQIQAVLATCDQQQPYTNLMAFVATGDLKRLLFATYRETRKYTHLVANPRVAMLIDNRTGQLWDHHGSIAVTATGLVGEVNEAEKDSLLHLYLAKHPNLNEFVMSSACALLEMKVEQYWIVRQFHQVEHLSLVKSADHA